MAFPVIDILSHDANASMVMIPEELVLLDNYGLVRPLAPLKTSESVKIDQMIICFVMQGSIHVKINGEETDIMAGQVMTTLPESEGEFINASNDCRFIMFVIFPELLKMTFDDIYINYDRTVYEKGFLIEDCIEEQMSIYQLLYTELRKECVRMNYEYKMVVVRSYLNALLINNMKLIETTKNQEIQGNTNSRQYDLFQKFLEALNNYAKTERTVQFYADLLHISPKYLSFVALQYSDKNASQWIGEYVVHHAKTMISIHHMTSAEIAQELQFPNLISYNRFFKRIAGITPKEYKKSLNN